MDTNTLLCQVGHEEAVSALALALTAAGIPYSTTGHGEPSTAFFVPVRHLARARAIVDENLAPEGGDPAFAADELDSTFADEEPRGAAGRPVLAAPFPWRVVEGVVATVLFHTGLLFWAGGSLPSGRAVWQYAASVPGAPFDEPWRLVTAMFLHTSFGQVLWNGIAMLIFAVPVAGWLGGRRATTIYLAAGVAGGLVTTWLAPVGSVLLGSSAAVLGLFGAWLVVAFRQAKRRRFGWRSRVRSLGVAVLVLPGLLGLADDARVSAPSAHVAGALAGMATGFALALPARRDPANQVS